MNFPIFGYKRYLLLKEFMDINIIKQFAKFCQKELGIKHLPKIKLTELRDEIQTSAGYIRGKMIIIYIKGRHIIDICRSIAHELKHHKQWEDKEFNDTEKIQDVGGKFEDEANALAGVLIKKFAYNGHMDLYESKELMTEGRLEDAKKQFPSIPTDLIDYISQNDPSGNNKYLKWIIRRLRSNKQSNLYVAKSPLLDTVLATLRQFEDILPHISKKDINPSVTGDKIYERPKDINSYSSIEDLKVIIDLFSKKRESLMNTKDKDLATNREASGVINQKDPHLFVLSEFIGDDSARHYRENLNVTSNLKSYQYNNGKISNFYFVGTNDEVILAMKSVLEQKITKQPRQLFKNQDQLVHSINFNSLFNVVLNHLGFNNIYLSMDELRVNIKSYYPAPPMKLKTDQRLDNASDVKEMANIDSEIEFHNDLIKKQTKNLKTFTQLLARQNKMVSALAIKLNVLKIRLANHKDDAPELEKKISGFEHSLEQQRSPLQQIKDQIEKYESDITNSKREAGKLSDRYTGLINKVEASQGNKLNYEYSPEQIKTAKDKIKTDIATDPIKWVKKLKLSSGSLLQIVNVDKFAKLVAEKNIKNKDKSFGLYKFLETKQHNNTDYNIFLYEG